jgi:hypothetical protein
VRQYIPADGKVNKFPHPRGLPIDHHPSFCLHCFDFPEGCAGVLIFHRFSDSGEDMANATM